MMKIFKKIHEPSSSISDFILSIFCFYWFYDLIKVFLLYDSNTHLLSSIIFLFIGISAMLGSFFHMFAKMISNKLIGFNFKIAVFTIGLILLLFSFIYINLLINNNSKFILITIFSFFVIIFYYNYLVKNFKKYTLVLLPIALFISFGVYFQLINNYPGSKEILIGFLIILFGLIIWKKGLSINKNFNKNDIFHYVSIFGLWYLYQGFKLFIFFK